MQYKIQASVLNESFVDTVHQKTCYPVAELQQIISFINYIDATPRVTEQELSGFYQQLQLFYQNT